MDRHGARVRRPGEPAFRPLAVVVHAGGGGCFPRPGARATDARAVGRGDGRGEAEAQEDQKSYAESEAAGDARAGAGPCLIATAPRRVLTGPCPAQEPTPEVPPPEEEEEEPADDEVMEEAPPPPKRAARGKKKPAAKKPAAKKAAKKPAAKKAKKAKKEVLAIEPAPEGVRRSTRVRKAVKR